jgi:protein O-mannosyl-transferase
MPKPPSSGPLPAPSVANAAGAVWGVLQAVVILLAGAFVIAPAWRGAWLWDDVTEITGNPLLRNGAGLWRIWFSPPGPDYLPLKSTLEWLQWHWWGDAPAGYHLTSLGLHLLSAVLVWRLLNRLGIRFAWLGGLLFAVHPLVVESVAWVAEQKNTLSLPFLLLAACAYVDWDREGRRRAYLGALLWFVGAMLCKTSVVMFPVVLLLYGWWRRGAVTRRDLWTSLPFFAVAAALGVVGLWFQQRHAIGAASIPVGGVLSRLAVAGPAILFYLGKFLAPVALLPIYPRWPVAPPAPALLLAWLPLAAVLGWAWVRRAAWGRHVLLGAGWFLVNLVPVLGFVTISYFRITWVADHFVYLPLVGLAGLAAAGAGRLAARLPLRLRPYAGGAAVVLVAALAWQGRAYAAIFRDEETFWSYTVRHNPAAWMAQNNLGNVLARGGRPAEALPYFVAALALRPDYPEAHNNYGNALFATGRTAEAVAQHEAALRLEPDYAEAHFNLAAELCQQGRFAEAIPHFEAGLRRLPDFPEAHNNLGRALLQTGQVAAAAAQFEAAVRQRPDDPLARNNLGNVLGQLGRWADAVDQYQAALRQAPGFVEARLNLGITLLHLARWNEAREQFVRVLQLRPDNAKARANLDRLSVLQAEGAPGS